MFRSLLLACGLVLSALAQDGRAAYPDKPIKIIVPYMPGAPADTVARAIAEGLAKRLNQAVIVENRAGASGLIGTQALARSAPDGYTLGLGNLDTHVLNPLLYKNPGYHAENDFAPVGLAARGSLVLAASPALAARDGHELIALARSRPGKLTYGSWGQGSFAHLLALDLERRGGLQLLHVPFQGTPAIVTALMATQIDLAFVSPSQALPAYKVGKLKVIGTTSPQRLPQAPELPTLAEQGFGGYEGVIWLGIFAPAKTPAPILDVLNKELNEVLKSTEVAQRFAPMALAPEPGTRDDLARAIATSRDKWQKTITDRKIQLDQ